MPYIFQILMKWIMKRSTLTMTSIFQCMMEEGFYPIYEKTHIIFGLDDNQAVVEYEDGIASVRLYFSIEEDMYDLFLEAANETMMKTFGVKPVVTPDIKNLMLSCEILCDSQKEFRKFFPRCIKLIKEALKVHKMEMKRLLLAEDLISANNQTPDDYLHLAERSGIHKVLS